MARLVQLSQEVLETLREPMRQNPREYPRQRVLTYNPMADRISYRRDMYEKEKAYKQWVEQVNTERSASYQTFKNDILKKKGFANYGDPSQINSIVDAISQMFFKYNDEVSRFGGFGEWWKNNYGTALQNGQFGALGLNFLVGLGENLDAIDNLVKGAILQPFYDLSDNSVPATNVNPVDYWDSRFDTIANIGNSIIKGFKRALGADGTGRYNYYYETHKALVQLGGGEENLQPWVKQSLNRPDAKFSFFVLDMFLEYSLSPRAGLGSATGKIVKKVEDSVEIGVRKAMQNLPDAIEDAASKQIKILQTELMTHLYPKTAIGVDPARVAKIGEEIGAIQAEKLILLHAVKELSLDNSKGVMNRLVKVGTEAVTTVANPLRKGIKETAETLVKRKVVDSAQSAVVNTLSGYLFDSVKKLAPNLNIKGGITDSILNTLKSVEDTSLMKTNLLLLRGLSGMTKSVQLFEKSLFHAEMLGSVVGLPWYPIKKYASPYISEYVAKAVSKIYKPFIKADGTVSVLDFTKIKEKSLQDMSELKLAVSLSGETDVPADLVATVVKESVRRDEDTISHIIRENFNKPTELQQELQEFFKAKHGVNNMDEFLDALEQINKTANGELDASLKTYKEYAKYIENAQKRAEALKRNKDIRASVKTTKAVDAKFKEVFQDPLTDDVAVEKSMSSDSLRGTTEAETMVDSVLQLRNIEQFITASRSTSKKSTRDLNKKLKDLDLAKQSEDILANPTKHLTTRAEAAASIAEKQQRVLILEKELKKPRLPKADRLHLKKELSDLKADIKRTDKYIKEVDNILEDFIEIDADGNVINKLEIYYKRVEIRKGQIKGYLALDDAQKKAALPFLKEQDVIITVNGRDYFNPAIRDMREIAELWETKKNKLAQKRSKLEQKYLEAEKKFQAHFNLVNSEIRSARKIIAKIEADKVLLEKKYTELKNLQKELNRTPAEQLDSLRTKIKTLQGDIVRIERRANSNSINTQLTYVLYKGVLMNQKRHEIIEGVIDLFVKENNPLDMFLEVLKKAEVELPVLMKEIDVNIDAHVLHSIRALQVSTLAYRKKVLKKLEALLVDASQYTPQELLLKVYNIANTEKIVKHHTESLKDVIAFIERESAEVMEPVFKDMVYDTIEKLTSNLNKNSTAIVDDLMNANLSEFLKNAENNGVPLTEQNVRALYQEVYNFFDGDPEAWVNKLERKFQDLNNINLTPSTKKFTSNKKIEDLRIKIDERMQALSFLESNKSVLSLEEAADITPLKEEIEQLRADLKEALIKTPLPSKEHTKLMETYVNPRHTEGIGNNKAVKINVDTLKESVEEFGALLETPNLDFKNISNLRRIVGAIEDVEIQLKAIQRQGISDVDGLIEQLDAINPMKLKKQLVSLEEDMVAYKLKLEQLYVNLDLMNSPQLGQLVKEIRYSEEGKPGQWLNNVAAMEDHPLLNDLIQSAKIVKKLSESYSNYAKLLNNLNLIPMGDKQRIALMSTLQRYALNDPEDFLNNFDSMMKSIFQHTEEYLNTIAMKESFSLDFLKHTRFASEDELKALGYFQGHKAIEDVRLTRALMNKDLKDYFDKRPNIVFWVMDIETDDLNKHSGRITEIGVKSYHSGEELMYQVNDPANRRVPSLRALQKLGFVDPQTNRGNMAAWRREYANARKPIVTEREMLHKFLTDLDAQLKKMEGPVQLVFHNGETFDIGYILSRLEATGLKKDFPELYKQFDDMYKIDTLKMYRDKSGTYTSLDINTQRRITDDIRSYVEQMVDYKNSLIDAGRIKLIDPAGPEIARELGNISNFLRKASNDPKLRGSGILGNTRADAELRTVIINIFKDINDDVFGKLGAVKQLNKVYGRTVFDKAALTGEEGYKIFLEHLMKVYPNKSESELVAEFGTYLNMSKFLYATSDSLNMTGYKVSYDTAAIKEYFKFGADQTHITMLEAQAYTSLAKSLDRKYGRIINVELLDAVTPMQYRNTASILQKEITDNRYLAKLDIRVKANNDPKSAFVMTELLYDVAKRKNLLTDELVKKLDPNLVELLENKNLVYGKPNRFDEMVERLRTVQIDDTIASPADIIALSKEFQTITKDFDDFANDIDVHELLRSKSKTISSLLIPAQQMIDSFQQLVDKTVDKEKLINGLREFKNNLAIQQTLTILSVTENPKQFADFMAKYAPWIELNHVNLAHNKEFGMVYDRLLKNRDALKAEGVEFVTKDQRTYLVLSKDQNVKFLSELDDEGDDIIRVTRGANNDYVDDVVLPELEYTIDGTDEMKAFQTSVVAAKKSLNELTYGSASGSLGETLNTTGLRKLYEELPDEVKILLPDIDTLTEANRFKGVKFNFINIGDMSSRTARDSYISGTMIPSLIHSSQAAAKTYKTQLGYVNLVTSDMFKINKSFMAPLKNVDAKTAKAHDRKLLKMLQENPAFTMATLVTDKKGKMRLLEIQPNTLGSLQRARDMDAVLLPTHTFNIASASLNSPSWSEGKLKWWYRMLYTFKVGYLFTTGFFLRNEVDNAIKVSLDTSENIASQLTIKSGAMRDLYKYNKAVEDIIQLDMYDSIRLKANGIDPAAFIKVYQEDYARAVHILSLYDLTVDDIVRMDPSKYRITTPNVNLYFEKMNPRMDKEMYDLIHNLENEGALGRMSWSYEKYYGAMAERKAGEMTKPDKAWGWFVKKTNVLMAPAQFTEQASRLAEYLILARKGVPGTEALHKVMYTHFTAKGRSEAERLTETIFPFYTFALRNLEYWGDIAEKRPEALRLLLKGLTNSWGLDDPAKQEELKMSKSMQYNTLAGNIPIGDKGLVVKLSPSFMDALSIVTRPIESVKGKLFSPIDLGLDALLNNKDNIQKLPEWGINTLGSFKGAESKMPTGYDWFKASTPIAGTLAQRFGPGGTSDTIYERTGNRLASLIPSVFGAMKEYTDSFKGPKQLTFTPRNLRSTAPRFASKYEKSGKKYYARKGRRVFTKRSYPKRTRIRRPSHYTPRYYNNALWAKPFRMNQRFNPAARRNSYMRFRNDSIYNKLYTKTGQSRWGLMTTATKGGKTAQSLRYKLINMQRYLR